MAFEVVSLLPLELVARLAAVGIKVVPSSGRRCRAVTHYGIEREDIRIELVAI